MTDPTTKQARGNDGRWNYITGRLRCERGRRVRRWCKKYVTRMIRGLFKKQDRMEEP